MQPSPAIQYVLDLLKRDGELAHLGRHFHEGPGKRSVLRGIGSWRRYARNSRYSPAQVRELAAVNGVGRPPYHRRKAVPA